jgi:DNA-binding beta-propeller fold protein YncE
LNSSKPLHATKANPYSYGSGLALDLHGHLCVSSGNLSDQAIYEYDARTLKLLGQTDLAGYFSALVADRYGYLYASSVFGILVYAPGCTQRVNNLRHGGSALVFDRSGNLYASLGNAVGVYEPEQRRGHMRFVRRIHKGLKSLVSALAIGPSDELFVADEVGRKGGYVAVYRSGGSEPVETITNGIETPELLAVDSKGWLYVDNCPYTACGAGRRLGWISVYAPGSTQPTRRVRLEDPIALAIDPSDNLYVLDSYRRRTVLVYSPGAAKLLRKITDSVNYSAGLLIGSP